MDMTRLKALEKRVQIITAIEKAAPHGGEIWQTSAKGRQIYRIIEGQADYKQDKVIYRTPALNEVDPRFPIFVRLSYRNLIYRLEPFEFRVVGDKVICNYPVEAMGLEERKNNRYVLPFESDISLSLRKAAKETALDMEVRIIDVSERGFGLMISGLNKDFLRLYDHLWIKSIDNRPLYDHIYGTVLYVAPRGYYLKRGDVRLGISLHEALTWEMFEYLKKRSHMILSA